MIPADRNTKSAETDVCIVGAGPVGLALAFKLEALGLTVTLLEMGAGGPDNDAGAGGIEFTNGRHALSPAISRPGIGGASALWGGRCVALDDLDFDMRSHVPFSGWPIPHEALRRHYPEALTFLNCNPGKPALGDVGVSDGMIATDALERWSSSPDLGPVYSKRLQASRSIRLLNATATGIVLDPSGKRVEGLAARHEGGEIEIAAKTFVLAGGGLENARLLLSLQRDRPEACGGTDGPLGRFYQGHLTGYVAVLQFDNPGAAKQFAFQLDDKGSIFRRRLQIVPAVQTEEKLLNCVFWIDAISIADPVHGSGALSLAYLFLKTFGLYRRLSHGLAPTAKGSGNIDLREHWRNIRSDRRAVLDLVGSVRNLLQRRVSRWRTLINPKGRYLLRYHAEQVPNPESRVILQPHGKSSKRSVLAVDYRVVDQDLDSVLKSHEILDLWLRRNGVGRLEYLHDAPTRRQAVLDQAFDGYHQIGLSRMAKTPADGVADADCRVHGITNLYLAGSSLFPTGGHANPTLPAVALALRLAEHLKTVVTAASRAQAE
ncbi:Choline dehydrogenase [Xaviernesmea oryzae]|uniref:Choline dehydrogenase n=1 Tax=Xaviernesmea oryzae TaxID=464029 RepID=A0A1X7D767_9HYPH|nr:GMC oxidoreductase [Xaviernesmea oryzae]SMF10187.1 Choline dehydrogenase [Xaviernesmea oryzae]